MDSYKIFINDFNIDKQEFFSWGVEKTIFPPTEKVSVAWDNLKHRIYSDRTVYIRGYGRDAKKTGMYFDFYKFLIGNYHVEKDPTNNSEPSKHIEGLTGKKKNKDIFNYQISHIWGNTKNIFLFEAPWNICYTPKIIDPFTGHETKGEWPKEYQKIFLERAYNIYKPFVDEYNKIIIDLDIENKVEIYISEIEKEYSKKELVQFRKDVNNEFRPL